MNIVYTCYKAKLGDEQGFLDYDDIEMFSSSAKAIKFMTEHRDYAMMIEEADEQIFTEIKKEKGNDKSISSNKDKSRRKKK